MKTCRTCGQPKELTEFYAHKGFADGRLKECKLCYNQKRRRPARPLVHGIRGYWRGCKCAECKAGHVEYDRQQYLKKKFAIEQEDALIEREADEDDMNLPMVVEIRPYQPKLQWSVVSQPSSFFDMTKGFLRPASKQAKWKAA